MEVERWLRATEVADGTKAKIKCVMSALFSHAVRWEFCGHNPISSGIPVGTGGKRGPSTGVRISAKHQRSPLVLSPEEVKLGLAELEFRDQLQQARSEWLRALDTIEALRPQAVVAGHGVLDPDSSPLHIEETRRYLHDFNASVARTSTALDLYEKMLTLHPNRINPGSLWGTAKAVKPS